MTRYHAKKSSLFMRLLREYAIGYKQNPDAGQAVALRFLEDAERAVQFICDNPLSCLVYPEAQQHPELRDYQFHKWPLRTFPHSIFFRIRSETTLILEAIYPQRMDISRKLASDYLDD